MTATQTFTLHEEYSFLEIENVSRFTISATFLFHIRPQEDAHYFFADCGDCTWSYTLPELSVRSTDFGPELDVGTWLTAFRNSISRPTYRRLTVTLAPGDTMTFGPTDFPALTVPSALQTMDAFCTSHGFTLTNTCSSQKFWEILASWFQILD